MIQYSPILFFRKGAAMIASVLLLGAMVAGAPAADGPGPDASDLASYKAAAAGVGHDPDAHVRLAIWCEAHGLTAERMKHLALAVLYEPKNSLARGLMGLVAYQGKWQRPEQVSQEVQDDPQQKARIKEYLDRRSKAPDRAEDQWKLAVWCEQNGLKEQASAHLHRVVQLDPKRESAWKHLGYKRVGSRWIKPDEAAAAKVEAQRQKKANDHWRPVLERLRSSLQSKDASRRAEAEKTLAEITDRRAVPMVWATFGRGNASLQQSAVQVLGQIDDASASRSLVMSAVFSGSADVRRKAVETLRRRDAREFAGLLIAMIQKPIKYTVKRVGGPGRPGELYIYGQGSTPNLRRVYAPPAGPSITPLPGDRIEFDQYGLPVIDRQTGNAVVSTTLPMVEAAARQQTQMLMQSGSRSEDLLAHSGLGAQGQSLGRKMIGAIENQVASSGPWFTPSGEPTLWALVHGANQGGVPTPYSALRFYFAVGVRIPLGQMAVEAQKTAMFAESQLQSDVDEIKAFNASLDEVNGRVLPVLDDISGSDFGADPLAWQKWLNNLVGFNSLQASEPPTVTEQVPLAYQPQAIPLGTFSVAVNVMRISCFGAGTMVRTLSGSQPIESLKLGDQVLTQSIKTGALAYKPILVVHHNPPSKTFEIKLGEETIVSSHFHRFWKAGSGWVMARDLKVGDPIRTLNGTVQVKAIVDGKVVPVFNLDVADDADFFVGEVGALAHDNTVPDLRETPFDAIAIRGHSENSSRKQATGEGKP
jgi:Pretoxin HINT domain